MPWSIAGITLIYSDGTSINLPVLHGRHIRQFTALRHEVEKPPLDPTTRVAWRGEAPIPSASNFGIRLYHCILNNPHPEKVVVDMDIHSASPSGGWMLVAAMHGPAEKATIANTYTIPRYLEPDPGPRTGKQARPSGVVRDESGNPIAGVQIFMPGLGTFASWDKETSVGHPAANENPVTDKDGKFEFQNTTDQYTYRLIVLANSYEPEQYHRADPLRGPAEIRLRLKSVPPDNDTLVRGHLSDDHGEAIIGASVSASTGCSFRSNVMGLHRTSCRFPHRTSCRSSIWVQEVSSRDAS